MPDQTIVGLAAQIRAGARSPVEVTRGYLDRIAARNDELRAFITVDSEGALAAAHELEAAGRAGRWAGPLHGVPLAYKDLCFVPGLPTSCGTRTPNYFESEVECSATRRLSAAGAITLGKLNMTELAMGAYGDNAHHGNVQNPWLAGHVTGGSSSGSGAAVAAGLAAGALGSDTGGSIRLPAACCGIVGLKPTYGRVSRAGAMALSWTMDHLGPMTRTVRDNALLLGLLAGHDPLDGASSHHAVPDYLAELDAGVAGLRVGLPTGFFFDGVDPETAAGVRAAAATLERLGAQLRDVAVPDVRLLSDVANVIARTESAATHRELAQERPDELQPTVRTRLMVGFGLAAVDYAQALRLRPAITRDFIRRVFGSVDLLLTPTIPVPVPRLADATAGTPDEQAARMGEFSRLTRPFNTLGLPVLSLPCGFTGTGLPLAVQIVGRPFAEATVLRAGQAYEQATEWHRRRPPGCD